MKKKLGVGIIAVSLALVWISVSTSETPEVVPAKTSSTFKKILKASPTESVITKTLMYKTDKKLQVKVKKTSKLKKDYYAHFDMEPQRISDNLDVLEKKHYELLTEMRKSGVTIDPVTQLKPRLALALSYSLNLHISELTASDLSSLKYTNKEWYLIKTFSESNDFKIMLKRNTLTSSFVQIENLASIY